MSTGKHLPDPTLLPSDLGDDLGDGIRILTLTDGRFWPSVVRNTQLDGVFAVSIENARQSKSIIMCREDLLKDAVGREGLPNDIYKKKKKENLLLL